MKVTNRVILILVAVFLAATFFSIDLKAQFKNDAFSQQYNDDVSNQSDSVEVLFSLKDYFGGLKHEHEIKIGVMFGGSAVFIGGCQIYNKDYWKLPIVYGTIAGGLGAGFYYKSKESKIAPYFFAGAALAYWGTLMDGVINYKPDDYPHAGKATLYSLLVPGLGQIYNKEYWKLPIYYGLMGFGIHYYLDCKTNYNRFRNIYLEASDKSGGYNGPVSAEQALYYRNVYRRYRDYALLATGLVYLLQIIDANVFSYMHHFEVDDDLALDVSPTVIVPDMQFASFGNYSNSALGLRLGISF